MTGKAIGEHTLVLGMGGNVGGEAAVVERMRRVLEAVSGWEQPGIASGGGVKASSVYRTAPVGPDQADFLNAALRVRLDGDWQPRELMSAVLEIEALLGRDRLREARWGPRKIDLDVLVWGPRVARYEGPPVLEVPHPRVHERRFALQPMVDVLAWETELPGGKGRTLGQLLSAPEVAAQRVELTEWTLG
jgi:2-amino-4-hydroxy-6-hydroxymethyldihydropteridine diphosphokinase